MKPSSSESDGSVAQFTCAQCGGVLLYDPETSEMRCRQCRQPGDPALLAGVGPGAREIRLAEGMARASRGLGLRRQSVQCNACGAALALDPEERAGACIYCTSPLIVTRLASEQPITPESLVPFAISHKRATESFQKWLRGLWFRRGDLGRRASLEKIAGVYVPYWTFDAWVHSDWRAERGWNYQEEEEYTAQEDGKRVTRTRKVTRTRWEPAAGLRDDGFDDVLVCASKGVPEKLAGKMTSFETANLVPYSPAYLSGWRAEAYAIDLPDAWKAGKARMEAEQERRCAGDVGGDTHRSLTVRNVFSDETFKHVLLPLYVLAYRYRERAFQVLVNGQTGGVVGHAPWSFWKITLAVLATVALVTALILVFGDK